MLRTRLARVAILGALAGCAGAPQPPSPPASGTSPAPAPAPPAEAAAVVVRPRARWVAVDWSELPGWADDAVAEVWPALTAGCARPPPAWRATCADALLAPPRGDAGVRRWLAERLAPWRVEAPGGDAIGLATGYYEPLVAASRRAGGVYRTALHAPPPELAAMRPFYSRRQLETQPAAMALLRGRELAWVADPLDALLLQIQGSGRLDIAEPDGTRRSVRLAYAGSNEQPYASVGRWLVDHGELADGSASWPAIRAWARLHPERVQELLWADPRVVFFREEPLPDPGVGPRGAQGVALTPGRSVAVDPASVPLGSLVWIDSTEPLSSRPLRRLALAQDTGSAISGAVRIDLFWGWGAAAEANAGRMKQPLRLWALWPRGAAPAVAP